MVRAITIAAIVIGLLAFRFLLPPVPGIIRTFRRLGPRMSVLLGTVALACAALAIVVLRR